MTRRFRSGLSLLLALGGCSVPATPVVRAAPVARSARVVGVAPARLVSANAPAQAGPVYPQAVDIAVSYPAKTITVTARIDFYQPNGIRADSKLIETIVQTIEAKWNGHKFKCFNVIVHVDAGSVQTQAGARPNAVDIKLDNSRLLAFSSLVGNSGSQPLSDDPANRLQAGRDPQSPIATTWGKYTDPVVWPHEFGHVLGLDDNYDPKDNSKLIPGAKRDLMFSQGLDVSPEMITRMIRRNNRGQLDESKVKCPLSMDAGPASVNLAIVQINDLMLHAYTCDYDPPSSDPAHAPRPISWKGEGSLSGSYNIPVLGGTGSFAGAFTFTSEAEKPYSFTLTSSSGSSTFGGTYQWTTTGVPVSTAPLTLGGVSSDQVGLGLYPEFTEGARECP